jgi:hypothetical protein
MLVNWYEIISEALKGFWISFINFIPNLLVAIIVFIIGWIVAVIIAKIISQILQRLQFNRLFEKASWREALEKAEIKVNPAEFIGAIFKWVLVILVILISLQILLGLQDLSDNPFKLLLDKFLIWIPNFVVAIVIFVVAVIVADLLDKIIVASVNRIGVEYVGMLGIIVRWIIYILAGLAILNQLEVAPALINTLIIAFFGMIALAFGLAFGLGGKDTAAKLIEDLRRKIAEK